MNWRHVLASEDIHVGAVVKERIPDNSLNRYHWSFQDFTVDAIERGIATVTPVQRDRPKGSVKVPLDRSSHQVRVEDLLYIGESQ